MTSGENSQLGAIVSALLALEDAAARSQAAPLPLRGSAATRSLEALCASQTKVRGSRAVKNLHAPGTNPSGPAFGVGAKVAPTRQNSRVL